MQLNKLKSGIKEIGTEVTLKISSNVVGHSNDENNFPHKLLLTNTQVSRLRKAFPNNSLANIELLKTRKSGEFVGRLLGSLLKTGLPLIGNVNTINTIRINRSSISNRCSYHKKMFRSDRRPSDLTSRNTTLIISNEEMNDIMKIIKSLEESGLLIKALAKQLKMKQKNKKEAF